MIRMFGLIVAAFLFLAVPHVTYSADNQGIGSKGVRSATQDRLISKSLKTSKKRQMTGKLLGVDKENASLKLQWKARQIAFGYDEKTRVHIGSEARPISELKEGQRITILYTDIDGRKIASLIRIVQ